MERFLERKEFAASPGVNKAVVQLKLGESTEEAWNRHLKENPNAALATLRIFKSSQCLTELQSVEHG